MKRISWITIIILTMFAIGCEKERHDSLNIKILTGKNEYVVNSKIDVTLKNDLYKQAAHFKCDNVDLCPAIILKNENGLWIENEYAVVCTQMGPMGYLGILDIAETKHDTILLFNEVGKFKLRYKFVVDNDTLDFDSNEFLLYGLEL
ncbi:hypothetical protein ACE01N_20205 [Saccharicrinis sp. FJH2]|uniref:hypothetical protein n=1 Tax=Saccharicrinis sp. FJH65 TaxID=3344659 RepID=UPI0035F277F4